MSVERFISEGDLEQAEKTPFYVVRAIYCGKTTDYELPFGKVIKEYRKIMRADLSLQYYSAFWKVAHFLEGGFRQLENPLESERGVAEEMKVMTLQNETLAIENVMAASWILESTEASVLTVALEQPDVLFPLSRNYPFPLYLHRKISDPVGGACCLSLLVADVNEANRLAGGKNENIIRIPLPRRVDLGSVRWQ